MRKIWLIARREYVFNFRRRSFLFSAFGVPLFSIAMMFLIFSITEESVSATGQLGNVGYVDAAGILVEAAEKPAEYVAYPDEDTAHRSFLDGDIGAYFVIPPDFLVGGEVDAFVRENVPIGIRDQFTEFVHANLALMVPEDSPVDRVLDPMDLTIVELASGDEVNDPDAIVGKLILPFVFGFVFLMAVNTTSQFLMSGVIEEKVNRMMEVLVTSCTPLEMLWGKVLGLGALGLTQVVVWAIAGVILVNLQPDSDILSGLSVSLDFAVIGGLYMVLGYFLFGAIMAGIGASVTAEQEGRQFAGLFTIVAVLPFMLLVTFMQDPNGTLPTVFSLVPVTAPMSMLMRMPMTSVPAWQVVLSLVLLLASVLLTVWLASRIFRIGLLMYGKRLTLRDLLTAVRQGRRTMLTVAHDEGVAT